METIKKRPTRHAANQAMRIRRWAYMRGLIATSHRGRWMLRDMATGQIVGGMIAVDPDDIDAYLASVPLPNPVPAA